MINMPETIEADRIVLSRPKPTFDLAKEIYAKVEKSRESLKKWLPWAYTVNSPEDEFLYLTGWCDKHWEERSGFAYLLREKQSGNFLGLIDLIKVNEKHKLAEIGYWLSIDAEGQGYMGEAVKALEQETFKAGMNRLEIRNDTQNIRSAKVAERAGYHLDGVLRQDRWCEDKQRFRDTNVWSKLKSELANV